MIITDDLGEHVKPLNGFHVYRGNSHAHSFFTWTHGEHRSRAVNDLTAPTEFHEDWNVPHGVDWRDYTSISFNPQDYTNLQGLPINHFDLAIAHGYDFYAVTDHSQEPTLQPVSVTQRVWQYLLSMVDRYNRKYKNKFVALSGFEYSRNTEANGGSGHINVLNSSEYINADYGQRGPAAPWPGANWNIPQFYEWVKTAKPNGLGNVAVGFNHPKPNQYNDWDHIDEEIVKHISTFELHTNFNEIRWEAYLRALHKGWKVSPIGVHDNHGYSSILNDDLPPPTLVLAHRLTKEAITEAMRLRRTFVSWNKGVELRYAVNGHIMGSVLDGPQQFNFQIEITTPASRPDEYVRSIQILRNHPDLDDDVQVVSELLVEGNTDSIVWSPVIEDSTAQYFLLRIHHANDVKPDGHFERHGSTVSAPVWTGN